MLTIETPSATDTRLELIALMAELAEVRRQVQDQAYEIVELRNQLASESKRASVALEDDRFLAGDPTRYSDPEVGIIGTAETGNGVCGASRSGNGVQGTSDTGVGLRGHSAVDAGVYGSSGDGAGIHGTSYAGYGARLSGGKAPLCLEPQAALGPPNCGTHLRGELVLDAHGYLWICTGPGAPGIWRAVALEP